jgi:rhamnosyltransferase
VNNIPHVAILLAAYNGEKYIVEQLQSLIAQTHNKISIFVSDDSVNEETYNVIHDFIVTNQIQTYII